MSETPADPNTSELTAVGTIYAPNAAGVPAAAARFANDFLGNGPGEVLSVEVASLSDTLGYAAENRYGGTCTVKVSVPVPAALTASLGYPEATA